LPAFELTAANAGAVASLCRELDGIPLSIELSTAKMGALAVEQVAERLEGSPKLLSGGDRTVDDRHRTLRATLDWSYELLGEPERVLFRRLSVFAGGWPLEAAEEVGADDGIEQGDVLDLLSRLVNKSMVVVGSVEGGAARYGMLELVHRYRQERLQASEEAEAARRRHAALLLPAGRGGRAVAEGRAPRGLARAARRRVREPQGGPRLGAGEGGGGSRPLVRRGARGERGHASDPLPYQGPRPGRLDSQGVRSA
jgi:predicted ATPase